MPNYTITYAHMDDASKDPDTQAGWGEMSITTDVAIETDEQLKEVSRQIGLTKGFTRVNIVRVEEIDDTVGDNVE